MNGTHAREISMKRWSANKNYESSLSNEFQFRIKFRLRKEFFNDRGDFKVNTFLLEIKPPFELRGKASKFKLPFDCPKINLMKYYVENRSSVIVERRQKDSRGRRCLRKHLHKISILSSAGMSRFWNLWHTSTQFHFMETELIKSKPPSMSANFLFILFRNVELLQLILMSLWTRTTD